MPQDAKPKQPGSTAGKARLMTLSDLDRRTSAYMRTAETLEGILSDLGGADRLTTLERSLAESVAVMGTMLKDFEIRFLKGEQIDVAAYTTLANARRRDATTIGLERRKRDVTPDIRAFVKSYAGQREGAA